ncbi:tetratricopeptide repeat protein [Agarivorans sp. MS3-6]
MKTFITWFVACSSLILSVVFQVQANTELSASNSSLNGWCASLRKQQICLNLHLQLAENGRADSAYWVAKANARGTFEDADFTKAADYYQLASNQQHPDASRELGLLHYHGVIGQRDFVKAQGLFEQAVAQGNAEGIWALARMYHYGRGVEQSYQKAFELFTLAAELGSKPAASTLAYYYKVGLATEVNPRLASYWGNKARVKRLVTWNRSIPDYR